MPDSLRHFDQLLFSILPYLSIASMIAGVVWARCAPAPEGRTEPAGGWAPGAFTLSLTAVFLGHLLAFLLPGSLLRWSSRPLRLYSLEVLGLGLGLMALASWLLYLSRERWSIHSSEERFADRALALTVLFSLASGVCAALFHRWGSSWFAALLTPYLRSLLTLNPDLGHVTPLPWSMRLHVVSAWLILALIPFTTPARRWLAAAAGPPAPSTEDGLQGS